jgi:hypothetical protein
LWCWRNIWCSNIKRFSVVFCCSYFFDYFHSLFHWLFQSSFSGLQINCSKRKKSSLMLLKLWLKFKLINISCWCNNKKIIICAVYWTKHAIQYFAIILFNYII